MISAFRSRSRRKGDYALEVVSPSCGTRLKIRHCCYLYERKIPVQVFIARVFKKAMLELKTLICFGGCFVRPCLIDIKPTIDNFCSFGEPKRHYCRLYCFACNLATSINTSHEEMDTLPRGIIINSVFHCRIQSSLRITLQTAGWKEDPRMCSLFVIMVPPWILPLFCANLMVIVVLFF